MTNFLNVYFLNKNQLDSHPLKQIFEEQNFEGDYKKYLLLPEKKEIYLGLELNTYTKNNDKFFKLDWYEIGITLVRAIEELKLSKLFINYHSKFAEIKNPHPLNINSNLANFLLGINQANFYFDTYLNSKKKNTKEMIIEIAPELKKYQKKEFENYVKNLNLGVTLTRKLTDETPEKINPETMPQIIKSEFENNSNIEIKIYPFEKLKEMKMEGITFVGRASRYKPCLVHTILKPNKNIKNKICLIGKGITYDAGGLDIKTEGHMATMKSDMAGSATMFGVTKTLSNLNLENTEVHWISSFAENMVDGNSYKADDIITTYSGQTVEVKNTDAEGRLTLADGLAFATLQDPDYIVDAATLTGACVVAVSEYFTALMTNDEIFSKNLMQSFIEEGEKTVETPLSEVLRSKVWSKIADLNNTSELKRQAGHITAGLFLSHFVDQNLFRNPELKINNPKSYKWIHLDIAGSAFNTNNNSLLIEGATGQSVRSLVNWILKLDKGLI